MKHTDVKSVRNFDDLSALMEQGYKLVCWSYFFDNREETLYTLEKSVEEPKK